MKVKENQCQWISFQTKLRVTHTNQKNTFDQIKQSSSRANATVLTNAFWRGETISFFYASKKWAYWAQLTLMNDQQWLESKSPGVVLPSGNHIVYHSPWPFFPTIHHAVVPQATEPTRILGNSAIIWSLPMEQQTCFRPAFTSYSTWREHETKWNYRARKEPYSWACWAARPRWRRACSWTGSRRFRWAAASASEPPAASARSLQVQHEAELVTS